MVEHAYEGDHTQSIVQADRLTPIPTVFREDVEQDVDVQVQQQLIKAGITDDTIDKLCDAARELMKPVNSKEELQALQDALTPLVRERNKIVRICEKGREYHNMVRSAFIKAEKLYSAKFKEVENLLEKYKDEYKEKLAKQKEEEEAEAERQKQFRYAALEELGAIRRAATPTEPDRYVAGTTVVPIGNIDTMEAEPWDNLVRSIRMAVEEAARAKAEQERIAQEERDRLQAQREEHERKERELKEREERLNKQVNEARKNELLAAGCVPAADDKIHVVAGIREPLTSLWSQPIASLFAYDDTQWMGVVHEARGALQKAILLNEAQQSEELELKAKQQREALRKERDVKLREAGFYTECGDHEGDPCFYNLNPPEGRISINFDDLVGLTDAQFHDLVDAGHREKERKETIRRQEQEKMERGENRVRALKEAGWIINGANLVLALNGANYSYEISRLADESDVEFSNMIDCGKDELARRAQAEKDRIAAAAVEAERKRLEDEAARAAAEEQERRTKLTDLDKWNEWVASIKASAPKLSSEIANHAVGRVIKGLDAMTPNLFVEQPPKK